MSDTWKLEFKANNNILSVGLGLFDRVELLGATCATTLRAEVPTRARTFRILPGETAQNLVFVRLMRDGREFFKLIHIQKKSDKLQAATDPVDLDEVVGADVALQMYDGWVEVGSKGILFSSSVHGARFVDASSILRFVTGELKHEDLVRRAGRVKRVRALAGRVAALEKENVTLQHRLNRAEELTRRTLEAILS